MTTDGRSGDWLQTISGRQFYPFDPRPEDVDVGDIAHALSMQCRFAGHCMEFYSVAQHSVLVSFLCPPELALAGLLHDAHEAYTGDLIRPIKRSLREFTSAYDALADHAQGVIYQALGVPASTGTPDAIQRADTLALLVERRDLLRPGPAACRWREDGESPDLVALIDRVPPLVPLSPRLAARAFTDRYRELRS